MRALLPQPEVERRVLAEVITNPTALAIADNLEVDDFVVLAHQWAFRALRNLQTTDAPIGIEEIADAIALDDIAHDTHCRETVNVISLALIVVEAARYGEAFDEWFRADLRHLRIIASSRRAVMEAA
jgi:replicative DNA helicase